MHGAHAHHVPAHARPRRPPRGWSTPPSCIRHGRAAMSRSGRPAAPLRTFHDRLWRPRHVAPPQPRSPAAAAGCPTLSKRWQCDGQAAIEDTQEAPARHRFVPCTAVNVGAHPPPPLTLPPKGRGAPPNQGCRCTIGTGCARTAARVLSPPPPRRRAARLHCAPKGRTLEEAECAGAAKSTP